MLSRLRRLFIQAAQLSMITPKEQRNETGLVLSLLQGFEFNNTTSLFAVLRAGISGSFDRETGLASISIVSFVPAAALEHMGDVTHIRFSAAAAAVNFSTCEVQKQFLDGDFLPISQEPSSPLTLPVSLPAGIADPVLLLLKLQYFREVNGEMQERFTAACCTCTVVKVIS